MAEALFVGGNDNLLEVTGLRDVTSASTSRISGATVTATLETSTGGAVSGATNVTLSETTSAGDYRTTLGSTLSLDHQTDYVAKIDAVASSGPTAHWELELDARVRRS